MGGNDFFGNQSNFKLKPKVNFLLKYININSTLYISY